MSETLIAALEGIQRGKMPEDLHNLLRMLHNGYAETREVKTRNANGSVCLRTYYLVITEQGENLLEAVE